MKLAANTLGIDNDNPVNYLESLQQHILWKTGTGILGLVFWVKLELWLDALYRTDKWLVNMR